LRPDADTANGRLDLRILNNYSAHLFAAHEWCRVSGTTVEAPAFTACGKT
jgi:hypothetical protein